MNITITNFSIGQSLRIGIVMLTYFLLTSQAWAAPPPKMVINKMDNDGDGRISIDEWIKAPHVFERIDANNDGYATFEEIKDFRSKRAINQFDEASSSIPTSPVRKSATDDKKSQEKEGWIDVHFHLIADKGDIDGFEKAATRAIKIMDDAGIAKIIVMPPPRLHPNFDVESILGLTKKYGSRIVIMGGGGTLNPMIQTAGHSPVVSDELRNRFKETAEKFIAAGVKGFGEITAHHVSLTPRHRYESVPADNPLLLLLADIAAHHNVPIDLHFDPVPKDVKTPSRLTSPKNPPVLKENITALDRLLSHNRKANFVWAHAGSDPVGWYKPKLVRKMLDKHPNLFFSIRPVNKPHTNPAWHPKRGINHSWIKVFKEYPDRFVLGTDSFVVSGNYSNQASPALTFEQYSRIQREGAKEVLYSLKKDVARKIAHDNAIRIYQLNE